MTQASPRFRDRLSLDEANGAWMDQTRRYLMMRPDAFMGIFHNLSEPARRHALEAFAQSIAVHGADSARAYLEMGGTAERLLEITAETAPQLGWGRWQFTRGPDGLDLEVFNSPFAAGFGTADYPVCHGIKGMLQAVGGIVLDAPVSVTELACAALGAPACLFDVRVANNS